MKPLIGISGRRLSASVIDKMDARFARREIDFYFSDYARCVSAAGGTPVLLPYEADGTEVVPRLDGVIITGGQDVHPGFRGGDRMPAVQGESARTDGSAYDLERDAHEESLVVTAVKLGVPVLGVCRGHQMLNIALGGTLISDLPESSVHHYPQEEALTDGRDDHVVAFSPGSLAASIYGDRRRLNSWHHQAVATCGAELQVSARAADGVVEAIEIPGRPVLGVQWHPEWQRTTDPAFDWLVTQATQRTTTGSELFSQELS